MRDEYKNGCYIANGLYLRGTSDGLAVCGLAEGFAPEELIIPDNIMRIFPNAFEDCTFMEKAVIGKGVRHVGGYAFRGCTSLKKIYLRKSLFIDETVFEKCPQLTELHYTDPFEFDYLILNGSFKELGIAVFTLIGSGADERRLLEFADTVWNGRTKLLVYNNILWYARHFGDERLEGMLTKQKETSHEAAFLLGDMHALEKLMRSHDSTLTPKQLDQYIDISAKQVKTAMYIFLVNMKNELDGYSDDTDIRKKLEL